MKTSKAQTKTKQQQTNKQTKTTKNKQTTNTTIKFSIDRHMFINT